MRAQCAVAGHQPVAREVNRVWPCVSLRMGNTFRSRRSATVPLCGFGRTAPPPAAHRPTTGGTRVLKVGGAERTDGARRFNRMEAWQPTRWHFDAGALEWRASGRSAWAARDARLTESSTEVLGRQWAE